MKKILLIFGLVLFCKIIVAQETGTFTDTRDGKVYKTVTIGTQIWLAENLAYKAKSGCWVYGNDSNNVVKYGYLYNWQTAKEVCPAGWHLPSNAEWATLITYLGGDEIAGGKLKEVDTIHWKGPNTGATNGSGFKALPGGYRCSLGSFNFIGGNGYWWSSTEFGANQACCRFMGCSFSDVSRTFESKAGGYSVRCIKN